MDLFEIWGQLNNNKGEHIKARVTLPKCLIFAEVVKGRGREVGSFSTKKFMLQILDLYTQLFELAFPKKKEYDFPKMRGVGSKSRLELF